MNLLLNHPTPPSVKANGSSRRTQLERTTQTRKQLINATIECLIAEGSKGLTVGSIAKRAGVSHGAAGHHFKSKADLMMAAAERLIRRAFRRAGDAFNQLADVPQNEKARALTEIWSQTYDADELVAFMELLLESKRDSELAKTVRPLFQAGEKVFREVADYYFEPLDPELGPHAVLMIGQWIARGIEMDSHVFKHRDQKVKIFRQAGKILSCHLKLREGVTVPPQPSAAWLDLLDSLN